MVVRSWECSKECRVPDLDLEQDRLQRKREKRGNKLQKNSPVIRTRRGWDAAAGQPLLTVTMETEERAMAEAPRCSAAAMIKLLLAGAQPRWSVQLITSLDCIALNQLSKR